MMGTAAPGGSGVLFLTVTKKRMIPPLVLGSTIQVPRRATSEAPGSSPEPRARVPPSLKDVRTWVDE